MDQTFANSATPDIATECSSLEKIIAARYFIPAISTVGAILCFAAGGEGALALIGLVLMALGVIVALTVCPLKLLGFPLLAAGKGFKFCRGFVPFYGIGDVIAALIGVTFGFMFGVAVVLCCPVIFTLIKRSDN